MSFPITQHALALLEQEPQAYTVIFPDPASPLGVRAGLARGMHAQIATAPHAWVTNDFDGIPIFSRPIGNATWDAEARCWRHFTAATSPYFSLAPTEPCREVVYRCQPFWYRLTSVGSGGPHAVSVADRPLPGFRLAPLFRNGTDFVYRSVFAMSLGADGLPHSRGNARALQGSLAELWTLARRYDSGARPEGAREWFSDLLLQTVEFACADPSLILHGCEGSVLPQMGTVVAEANSSCYASARGDGCVWRGKEHPWGGALSVLADLAAARESNADGTQVRLYYQPTPFRFMGWLGERYEAAGILPARAGETVPLSGFALCKGDFLYPAYAAEGGVATRGAVAMEGGDLFDGPLCVSIGGARDSATRFALTYTEGEHGHALCGRLIVG